MTRSRGRPLARAKEHGERSAAREWPSPPDRRAQRSLQCSGRRLARRRAACAPSSAGGQTASPPRVHTSPAGIPGPTRGARSRKRAGFRACPPRKVAATARKVFSSARRAGPRVCADFALARRDPRGAHARDGSLCRSGQTSCAGDGRGLAPRRVRSAQSSRLDTTAATMSPTGPITEQSKNQKQPPRPFVVAIHAPRMPQSSQTGMPSSSLIEPRR